MQGWIIYREKVNGEKQKAKEWYSFTSVSLNENCMEELRNRSNMNLEKQRSMDSGAVKRKSAPYMIEAELIGSTLIDAVRDCARTKRYL
jgi:hypothetical protein